MNMPENSGQPNPFQNTQQSAGAPASNPGMVPGVILLVVGLLGILINGYFAFSCYTVSNNEEAMAKARTEMRKSLDQQKDGMSDEEKKQMEATATWMMDSFETIMTNGVTMFVSFLVLSVLTILGGVGLMKGSKGMAMIGSLAAIIPQSCCLIGLPVGIWGIFAAMKIGK